MRRSYHMLCSFYQISRKKYLHHQDAAGVAAMQWADIAIYKIER
jgi:hypothetical protein